MTSIAVALGGAACSRTEHDTTRTTGAVEQPANDTAVNARDRNGGTTTPFDQPNDNADLKTAAAIRRAVVGDSSLSMDAKNVKIVVEDGTVTLRGPVKTEAEKAEVEKQATAIVGVGHVEDHLDIENFH